MLKNFAKFEITDLITIFGEESLINFNYDFISQGVSIDSRTVEAGNIFVALQGESIDGHDKVQNAFDNGAIAAVVSSSWYNNNANNFNGKSFIIVKDTLVAIGELARFHRFRFNIPILAIGGSNGKTTTKDITAHILSKKFNVLKSYQNFNNRIGVPLMMLSLNESYNIAVLEVGTNEPGEIYLLSQMLAPTEGLITNIGKEHLEKLVDLDGVEVEETSLFGWLHRKKGTCFINLDEERLAKYTGILNNKFTYATQTDAKVMATIEIDDELHPFLNIRYSEIEISSKMRTVGLASGLNAVAAAAVAFYYGLTEHQIKEALEEFAPEEYKSGYARMILERIGDFLVLNDCYNANPSSMRIALKTLSLFKNRERKIAILGDMREMGESAESEHLELVKFASSVCDLVLTYGSEMEKATNMLKLANAKYFSSFEEIFDEIRQYSNDSVFLIKGSRGIKMEKLIEIIKKHLQL